MKIKKVVRELFTNYEYRSTIRESNSLGPHLVAFRPSGKRTWYHLHDVQMELVATNLSFGNFP